MKRNVLCVERNSSLRFLLQTVLKKQGNVNCVSNAFEASDYLHRAEKTHCLVLSIESNSDENLALLRHVKTSSSLKHIPVIVLSGTDDEWVRSICQEFEVEAFFLKPFDPLALVRVIEDLPIEKGEMQIIMKKQKILNLN